MFTFLPQYDGKRVGPVFSKLRFFFWFFSKDCG